MLRVDAPEVVFAGAPGSDRSIQNQNRAAPGAAAQRHHHHVGDDDELGPCLSGRGTVTSFGPNP
jgi:hypothetical protein